MAQLRHDHEKFKALNAEVLVVVPNGPKMIERYVSSHAIPYPILSDKGAKVAERYVIDTKHAYVPAFISVFTPSVFLVDMSGRICYTNYTTSYVKKPDNREPLGVLTHMKG